MLIVPVCVTSKTLICFNKIKIKIKMVKNYRFMFRLYDTMKEFLKRQDKTQKLLTVLLFNNNVLSILILIISKKKCKICYKFWFNNILYSFKVWQFLFL